MINISLTTDQALSLRNLLNLAVRAGGMEAAELALPIDAIIMDAARKSESGDINKLELVR